MVDAALREVVDKQQIQELQVRYSLAIDGGRYDDLDHIFTADVLSDYGHAGAHHGVEPIKQMCREALDPLTAAQHQNGNHWADVDGDTAVAGCYFTVQQYRQGTEGGEHFRMGGRYDDELVRTPEGWRIRRRTLRVLWSEGNPAVRFDR